jgi:hypothetical protein
MILLSSPRSMQAALPAEAPARAARQPLPGAWGSGAAPSAVVSGIQMRLKFPGAIRRVKSAGKSNELRVRIAAGRCESPRVPGSGHPAGKWERLALPAALPSRRGYFTPTAVGALGMGPAVLVPPAVTGIPVALGVPDESTTKR